MFQSRKLLWILLPLSAIILLTVIVRSQQNQNQRQQPPERIEDRKPWKRWEWAYRQRAYPGNEIPENALERAEQQLQQWKQRFRQEGLEAIPGRWVNIGPAPITGGQMSVGDQKRPVSGRVTDIAVDPTNANHWLIGAAQGGVWETRDAGVTWAPLTDNEMSLAIGAIAFAPSNPQIIYAGTGEAPIGGTPYAGQGLLKSSDGGKSWQLLAQTQFAGLGFSDIKVDPKNPEIAVAALVPGPVSFGATKPPGTVPFAGVFKTMDGGKIWTDTLTSNGFATDLESDPSDFNRQYAAIGYVGGDPGNGIYRSTNAGSGWGRIDGPWASKAGGVGRVELAIAPSNPKVMYVSIQDADTTPDAGNDNQLLGIWRTSDAWATPVVWEELTLNASLQAEPQWYYDHEIIVDETNPNTLYVGGKHLWKSPDTTKGSSIVWEQLDNKPDNALHVDQHTMAWTRTPQTQQAAINSLDKLPMSFEPNQGQARESVKFLSRGHGYNLQLKATEAVLQLQKAAGYGARISTDGMRQLQNSATVKMKLIGANKAPLIVGQSQLPGKSNYYIGNDHQQWRTGIPNYAAVRYEEVWPGIDLAYYGNQQRLEYDFIVAPGVSPKRIKLGFRGARKLSISQKGDLVLRTRGGKIRLLKPVIYQEDKGVRTEIRGRYVRRGKRHIGFQVAAYDRSLPLVIDPVIEYSTYLGPASPDHANDIALDQAGNMYITGASHFTSEGFNAYVAKLNAAGTALLYSTAFIGNFNDIGWGIAVDKDGNAYVAGSTYSTNFPVRNALQPRNGVPNCTFQVGCSDAFVAKLDSAGAVVYATYLGGSDDPNGVGGDQAYDIAVDASGQAYVTGRTNSKNFPVKNAYQATGGTHPQIGNGETVVDGFISKLSAAGNELIYSTYLGGGSLDTCHSIALDAANNVYVTGVTTTVFSNVVNNFPTTPTAFQVTAPNDLQNAFVTKLSADGRALVYSTYLGGNNSDQGEGLAVDSAGHAYLIGLTASMNFPLEGPHQTANLGGSAFITKLKPDGSGLLYSSYFGKGVMTRTGGNPGAAIAIDAAGNAYITGSTAATDFPLVNSLSTTLGGLRDAFVAKIDTVSKTVVYATLLGGSGVDQGHGITVDAAGNAYVTGQTNSVNFPLKNPLQPKLGSSDANPDVFITKISDQTPARLIVGNDGGVWSSPDGGQTWSDHNTNLAITQFYTGSLHPTNANKAFGAGQDNGTAYWTGTTPWRSVLGGDGATSAFSSASPDTHWMVSSQNLGIARTTDGGATFKNVDVGIPAENRPFIGQCVKCPNNDNTFLAGTDSIWRTDDFFDNTQPKWEQKGTSLGATISAIAFAPTDNACGTWAYGSSTGQLRLTRDGGLTVTNLGAANLPNRYVTDLAFHPYNANVLYVTFSGFDPSPPAGQQPRHVFKTTNAFAANPTWVNVSPPLDIPHNAIAVDPANPEIVYVGTDMGVWRSANGGASWEHFGPDKGMPKITVYDLQINAQTDRVVAFTHGRGAFTFERNRADLAVTKTASPDPVGVDEDLTYIVTVENKGPDKATAVFLRDTLPPGVTLVTSSTSQGTCASDATGVSCQLGELNIGVTATVIILVKPKQPGSITNMAQVSSDEVDPNSANNKASVTTKVVAPATVKVENPRKTCVPMDAYPRIAPQLAAGPNFPAIPEQMPTQIKCTLEAEVVLDGISGNTGPVSMTIFDGFSPGLFFDRMIASSPSLTVASYTNNVLTFNPIQLALPPQTVLQRFNISFEYVAFLNDLAEQRDPQQNCITMRFADARNGKQVFERGGICANTNVLVPRLALEKYASTTTGLPGDTLQFTVIALNGGNIFLESVDLDAVLPNNTTLVSGSVEPPPTRVVGNRIEWRGLGPLNPRGALPVSYSVKIDANTPANAKLVDQAFAYAVTPNFAGAGTRRLNAASNLVTVMVMDTRTGVDLTLTAAPAAGCPLTTIDYTARVTNTGQVTLDRVRLSLTQGTESVAGSPTFPLELDPLGPGESRTINYKGRIGLKQKGTLVDVATVVGRPVNNGVQVSELVGRVATATVQVSPPAISKITPLSGAPGSNNLELKIEGVCFVPETVVSFQPNAGIQVIPPTPPDFGFIGTTELRRRINIASDASAGEREVLVTNPNGVSGGQRPFNIFTVTGAGAVIDVTPTTLDFASVTTGQNRDLSLTVRNIGGATLTINPIALNNPRFDVIAPAMPFTLASGAQQNVTVRFVPASAGPQTGVLALTSNATNRPRLNVTLSGAGVGTPDLTASPGSIDFGSSTVGQSVNRMLTLTNPGDAALTIYAITSSNPSYSVTLPTVPFTIPATGAASLTASFTPTSAGTQSGTLLIASNANNKNPLPIQVRGETPGEILATDDGTIETGALQDGLLIVNRLTPSRYPVTLNSMRIFIAQFQGLPSPVGEQIRLVAFTDPAGTGQPPANPSLIVDRMVTIPQVPANGGFIDFPVTAAGLTEAASLMIESGDLYIGYQSPRPARGVAFAADSSGPQQQRAFFSTNDGASYAKLTGVQNQQGTVTQVNVMMQASLGGLTPCSYAINPSSQVFTESGGNGTVTITATNGCNWATDSKANWITFSPNSSGSGNGTVNFVVATGTTPRQAVVTIAGHSFTVAQAEKVASVSGASYLRSGLASGAIASAFGVALAPKVEAAVSLPLPTELAGTSVKIRDATGIELFAPLFFVSPGQINFLIPQHIVPGTVLVTVNQTGGTTIGAALNDAVAPGIFAANQDGAGAPAGFAIRVKPNGQQIRESLYKFDTTTGKQVPVQIDLGPEGEVIILELYGTGIRGRSAQSAVSATIAGIAAGIEYADKQPGFLGLDQVNVRVPRNLIGKGEVNLVLTVEGKVANTVKLNIK